MVSGWNLRVWLECIGVVSGCCCKEVNYHEDIYILLYNNLLFPTPLVIALFLAAASLLLCLIFKNVFFVLCIYCRSGNVRR